MKKKIIAIVLTVIMVTSLSCCFGACDGGERDANTILLWAGGQWTGTDAEHLQTFIDWYNATNTLGLTVELEIITDFEQQFASARYIDECPDLMIWDRFNTPSYAFEDTLLALDDFIERDGVDGNKFNQTAYNEMSYQNVQYGIPLDLDMWGIYVNMDIIEAYNKANPTSAINCFWNESIDWTSENPLENATDKLDWTWNDLLNAAKKLKGFRYVNQEQGVDTVVKSGFDGDDIYEFFFNYYASTGSNFLDENDKAAFVDEYGLAVLDFFYKIYNEGTFTQGYNKQSNFTNCQLAMYTRPTYFISYLEEQGAGLTNVRFMPQPRYTGATGKNCGVLGGFGYVIPTPLTQDSAWQAKAERCWEFIKDTAYNESAMLKWAEVIQTVPALLSTHESEIITGNVILKDTVPYSETYTIRPPVPGWLNAQTSVFNNYINLFVKGGKSDRDTIMSTLVTMKNGTDSYLNWNEAE